MLRPLAKNASFLGLLRATCIGFTAVVLFGRAGEPVRPYLIARKEGVSFSSQVAAWVVERILDILMILIIFGVALTQVSHSAIRSSPRDRDHPPGGRRRGRSHRSRLPGAPDRSAPVSRRTSRSASWMPWPSFPTPMHARIDTFFTAFGEGMQSTRSSSFTLLLVLLQHARMAGYRRPASIASSVLSRPPPAWDSPIS